jgi:alpha-tubulin suppressor-like RCC1 family protein
MIGPPRSRFSSVAAGEDFSIFVTYTGEVLAAGTTHCGLFGVEGEHCHSQSWQYLRFGSRVHTISCGKAHVVALLANAKVVHEGKLRDRPAPPIAVPGCVNAVAGRHTTHLWNSEGQLFAVGANDRGQLGSSACSFKELHQVSLPGAFKAIHVSCGHHHTAVLLTENSEGLVQFVPMEDSPSSADHTRSNRWTEDISNISFSRGCSENNVVCVNLAPAIESYDAFWRAKLFAVTSAVSVAMVALGIYFAQRQRGL